MNLWNLQNVLKTNTSITTPQSVLSLYGLFSLFFQTLCWVLVHKSIPHGFCQHAPKPIQRSICHVGVTTSEYNTSSHHIRSANSQQSERWWRIGGVAMGEFGLTYGQVTSTSQTNGKGGVTCGRVKNSLGSTPHHTTRKYSRGLDVSQVHQRSQSTAVTSSHT